MFGWFKKSKNPGPDYSHVDSVAKAEALWRNGEFVKLQLLPPIFGGTDVAHNIVFVPSFVLDLKQGIDENTVMPLVEEGKVTRYSASPRYQDKSVVPIAIEISATEPANFTASLAIWGEALTEERPSAV